MTAGTIGTPVGPVFTDVGKFTAFRAVQADCQKPFFNTTTNMKKHGPWKIKTTQNVYHDPFVTLHVDQVVRPDGADGQHVVVGIKPGVCVIAVDEMRRVHLTREFHYAVGRQSIEGVSGGIEPGEDAAACAARELQEELGLVARDVRFMTTVDPFTSILLSPTQLFLATNLAPVPRSPEGTELIEPVVIPLADAVEMVFAGTITHAPTCVGLMMVERALRNQGKLR